MGRGSRLALGAIAAAVAAGQVAPSHLGASIALATAAILLVAEARPRFGARALLPVACGAGLIAIRLAIVPAGPSPLATVPDGDGPWRLVVEATGSPRDGHQSATLATAPDAMPAFTVAATLPAYPVVTPGDLVTVDGSIRPRPDSPYGEYLLRIGAVGTLTSRSLAIGPAPDSPGRRLELLRRGAALALTRVLPEPEAGLAAGILIGLRDLVDRDLAAAFTTAGVSHVVAISGWNIAIVAAAIGAMTGRLGRRRRSVVTIVAIVLYVAFAGASASVVRAALMAGVVLLARESGRAGRATAALAWAATILLVSDPALIGDAGFQLSSLATAGLIAWATPLTEWLGRLGGGRVPGWLAESLGVSLAAQAATLPIILVSFGRLAVLSPLVNLARRAARRAGDGRRCAGPGGRRRGRRRGTTRPRDRGRSARLGRPAVARHHRRHGGEPPVRQRHAPAAAGHRGGCAVGRRDRGRDMVASPAAGRSHRADEPVDPGHGTAHDHTRATGGRRAEHVEYEPSAATRERRCAAPQPGCHRLGRDRPTGRDRAHLHPRRRPGRRHPGRGLARRPPAHRRWSGSEPPDGRPRRQDPAVGPADRRRHPQPPPRGSRRRSRPAARALQGRPGLRAGHARPGAGYAAWLRDLARPGAPVRLGLAAGDHLDVDEIGLRVLWPIRGQVPATPPDGGTGINNVSVVLLGEIGQRRVLLMGDVEEGIDPSLLKDDLPHVDLLKVAHHGSRTATTQAFVDATRPTVAVASAGAGNPYGHPAKATLDRLAASGARVLRTDRDGTVVVGFDGNGMTVRAEGGRSIAAATRVPGARAAVVAKATTPAAFLCAIPVTGLVPAAAPPAEPATAAAGLTPPAHRRPCRDRRVPSRR